jgi:hypothetical protein
MGFCAYSYIGRGKEIMGCDRTRESEKKSMNTGVTDTKKPQ